MSQSHARRVAPGLLALGLILSFSLGAAGQTLTFSAQQESRPGWLDAGTFLVAQPGRFRWEATGVLGRTWYVQEYPGLMIGTAPGKGDVLEVLFGGDYERRDGSLSLGAGTYYVTVRRGFGVKNAAGDIREFPVYGSVTALLVVD